MTKKMLQGWLGWFALLSKDCGVLRLRGREMRIVGLNKNEYTIQDAFGREPAFTVKRDSNDLSDVQIRNSLSTI